MRSGIPGKWFNFCFVLKLEEGDPHSSCRFDAIRQYCTVTSTPYLLPYSRRKKKQDLIDD